METNDSTETRGMAGRLTAPLVAITMLGGMATMLGRRRRSKESRVQRAELMRTMSDPKVRAAVEAAQRALDEARLQITSRDGRKMQEQLSKRTNTAVNSTMNTVPPMMKDAGERARELAERLRAEGQARLPEINQRLREDVAPKAKNLAQDAVSEAEEILADARQRASELSKNARRDYGPEVSNKANALAGLLSAGSMTGFDMVRDKMTDIAGQAGKKSAKKGSRQVAKKAQSKAANALQKAGDQTKYVATESMMVGVWATLLGATIYFALLSREQRDRVKNFFGNMFGQVQDVMSDFQGGAEDYQNPTR